ncbi:MAG TPA: ATP-binding protein [Rhizomicrobium sp.]|jgi:two-component system cell cycle sensor histidine kinase PleC
MTAHALGIKEEPAAEETRMMRARLDFMAATLPMTVWVNPTWAAFAVIPFTGLFPIFGSLSWQRIVATIGVHLVNSVIAATLRGKYRRDPSGPERWLTRMVVFQSLVGLSWGLFAWLLWEPGNTLNHVLVVMSVVAVLWASAFSRALHKRVYYAGIAPTVVLLFARMAISSDETTVPLVLILVVTLLFAHLLAHGTRRHIEIMLRTKFANDDMTAELRETRDEALRKRFEAEAANASKTTFLANMSHELRTPLNAILGFSDIIANETFGEINNKRYQQYAADINASGSHLLNLINDILDVAKIEAGRMELQLKTLDPKRTIENALMVVIGRAEGKNQHISVQLDASGPQIFVDERALKQIVINLVSNAVKFTPNGGSICISGGFTQDGGYELCVEDSGRGIAPEFVERVFLPFNQIDNRYSRQEGGTGLGLSLVRGLAQLHGGRAWIESEVGVGTRVYVYFPVGMHGEVQSHDKMRAKG